MEFNKDVLEIFQFQGKISTALDTSPQGLWWKPELLHLVPRCPKKVPFQWIRSSPTAREVLSVAPSSLVQGGRGLSRHFFNLNSDFLVELDEVFLMKGLQRWALVQLARGFF